FAAPVGPCWSPHDLDRGDLLGRTQDEDPTEPLPLQAAERPLELRALVPDDVWTEGAIGSRGVPLGTDLLTDVEDDRNRQHVPIAGELDQRPACLLLHVGRVDDGRSPERETRIR